MDLNIHLKIIKNQKEAGYELEKIMADKDSLPMMAPKMLHYVLKIKDVDVRAANVIKQEMLSKGGEAAVAKWSSSFTKPTTDVILMGTLKQYRLVIKKMRLQPYGLKKMSAELEQVLLNLIDRKQTVWQCGRSRLVIGGRTLIMGILNVTPDSFWESGKYFNQKTAVDHALSMVEDGADIIDIGGESTRPGAIGISAEEEAERVIPVIKNLRKKSDIPISVDTQKSKVAKEAIALGANIINDVSALRSDPKMVDLVASTGVSLILMHMLGTPRDMQLNPSYDDLIAEIYMFLSDRVNHAVLSGIKKENLAIDPGIGFGKTPQQNLEILRRLEEFKSLGLPLLLGTSRKSTIGLVLDLPVEERVEGTAATVALGIANGAGIIRVHDVKEMSRVAKVADAVKEGIDWRG